MQIAQGWREISLGGLAILNAAHEQQTRKRGSLPQVPFQRESGEGSELVS
jgi:hypothetical protein